MKIIRLLLMALLYAMQVYGSTGMSLQKAIKIAQDSSISIIKAKNQLLNSYWEYGNFKSMLRPHVNLILTPVEYNRSVIRRYISQLDRDEFRDQRNLLFTYDLQLTQNLSFTGGQIYILSNLSFLRSYSSDSYNQFNTTPFKIGYTQDLFGYNPFRWDKMIESLKYEQAKREYAYSMEMIANDVTLYYFNIIIAKSIIDVIQNNLSRTQKVYNDGVIKYKNDAFSESSLLSIEKMLLEYKDELSVAKNNYYKAKFELMSYIGMEDEIIDDFQQPSKIPCDLIINVDQALEYCKKNNPLYIRQREKLLQGEKNLDKAKKSRFFEANINISIGYNNYSDKINNLYNHLMQQDVATLKVTIPLIDWGVRKGNYIVAKNNLELYKAEAKNDMSNLEQKVRSSVIAYNIEQSKLKTAELTVKLSHKIYDEIEKKFLAGSCNISELKDALLDIANSQNQFVQVLHDCWLSYYHIRLLTLYDFIENKDLTNIKYEYD